MEFLSTDPYTDLYKQHQYTIAVQIRSDIVVVLKNRNIELYLAPVIHSRMQSSDLSQSVVPFQTVPFPGDTTLFKASLRPLRPNDLWTEGKTIVVDAMHMSGRVQWTLTPGNQPTPGRQHAGYTSTTYDLGEDDNVDDELLHLRPTIRTFWDPTSQRILYLGKEGESTTDKFGLCGYWQNEKRPSPGLNRSWGIPRIEDDFPWICAIDQEMTVAAVGTGRGRVWIYELFSRGTDDSESVLRARFLC